MRGLGTGVEVVDPLTSPAQQSRYTMPCSPLLRRSYFETVVAETFLVTMNTLRQRFHHSHQPFAPLISCVASTLNHRSWVLGSAAKRAMSALNSSICSHVRNERLAMPICRVIANPASLARFQRLCLYLAANMLVSGNFLRRDTNYLPKSLHTYLPFHFKADYHIKN